MVHPPGASQIVRGKRMNLKELTNVKELVEEACDKLGFIIEMLEDELRSPTGDGESVSEAGDVESDAPSDPLEEAEVAARHAYDILGAILDVTEPHRKRFAAQSRGTRAVGSADSGQPLLPQAVLGAVLTTEGGKNGTPTKKRWTPGRRR